MGADAITAGHSHRVSAGRSESPYVHVQIGILPGHQAWCGKIKALGGRDCAGAEVDDSGMPIKYIPQKGPPSTPLRDRGETAILKSGAREVPETVQTPTC